jgi:hypothetical protein
MKKWNVSRRYPEEVEDFIKLRVQWFFFEYNLEDSEILECLKKDGIYIGKWTLVRLRFELGLKRRIRGAEAKAAADLLVRGILEEELKKGVVDGYGRQYLQVHLKQRYHCVARDRLFRIYRTINPEGVDRRKRDVQRRRGEYIVPGPNWLWSVDGHDKLKPYGIEIYAGVDAYSRYITWIYVGISSGTAVSVVHQYLETVRSSGVYPQFIRSDCGGETSMMSYAHFMLAKAADPDIQFQDCYMYGTSTANQRIESWWGFLSKGLTFRWRVCKSLSYVYCLLLILNLGIFL